MWSGVTNGMKMGQRHILINTRVCLCVFKCRRTSPWRRGLRSRTSRSTSRTSWMTFRYSNQSFRFCIYLFLSSITDKILITERKKTSFWALLMQSLPLAECWRDLHELVALGICLNIFSMNVVNCFYLNQLPQKCHFWFSKELLVLKGCFHSTQLYRLYSASGSCYNGCFVGVFSLY